MIDLHKLFYFVTSMLMILLTLTLFSTPIFSESLGKTAIDQSSLARRRLLPKAGQSKNLEETDGPDDLKFELGFVLMWDYDQFNGVHLNRAQEGRQVGNEIELRQARLDLRSKLNKDWQAEFQVSFDDSNSSPQVGDAYIAFSQWDDLTITVGQAKEPFGLEELIGSSSSNLIEQSMATRAFAPGRNPGVGLAGHRWPFLLALGAYETADRENKRDTYALTGRLVIVPWECKKHVFHLGVAGSVRDFGEEIYRIMEQAEVHTAAKIVRSIETQAKEVRLLGKELAWAIGPFSIQAEHMTAFIEAAAGDDAVYKGYYIQGSYFLTGEYRPYKHGRFRQIKPINYFGAFELTSGYSILDAVDNKRGVRVENLTLGLNYYLGKRIRLMVNYIKTNLIDGLSGEKGKAEAISSRLQYSL